MSDCSPSHRGIYSNSCGKPGAESLTFLCAGIFNKWIDKNRPYNPVVTGSCSESVLKQRYPL